ncbi:hypothetical protein NUSPORA_01581 [Nucleospora cyclopteri]
MLQSAKEQVLLNLAIYKAGVNTFKTTWIDVKKAFDLIDHNYLISCIEKFNLPKWILIFLKSITPRWNIAIQLCKNLIINKKVERSIFQEDSFSTFLFVLCMYPLSRKLTRLYPKEMFRKIVKIIHKTIFCLLMILCCSLQAMKVWLTSPKRFLIQ